MTLIIVGILLVGYFLIATEHLNKLNKSSVAMFLGVVAWILYSINGAEYVQAMHGTEYDAFLHGLASTQSSLQEFIASHLFMQYVMNACQVILFLIATSSIIEILNANEVFDFLAVWMRTRRSKELIWTLSLVTFLLSANIDNLTAAVTMVMVMRKLVPQVKHRFYYSCVILMAANAGGCFTAIGDTTSLILWTKHAITPSQFAQGLALPAIVAMAVTTFLASRKLPEHIELRSSLGKFSGDDYLLEQLLGKSKQIKEGQLLIKDELNNQEPLLNKIDQKMDNLESRMKKSNNKLASYLEKSSDSCLYWTIGIELVLLFIFFML